MRVRRQYTVAILALTGLFGLASAGRAQEPSGEPSVTEDGVVVIDATRGRLDELPEAETIRLRVRNTLAPVQSVVVSIVSPVRPEYVLGAVPPGATVEYIIDTRPYVGDLRFFATSGFRGFNILNGIQATGNARATWDLGLNFMRYERLEGEESTG